MQSRTKPNLVRVTAPGLPPSPALLFDEQLRQAAVSLRLPTWRSWGRAHVATNLVLVASSAAVGGWLWLYLAGLTPVPRASLSLMAWGLSYAFAKPFSHVLFDGFLARQLFATSSKVWFTELAIAFKTSLYENGVLVDRSWNGQPILSRFDVTQDLEAAEAVTISSPYANHVQRRRQTACILRMIVGVSSSNRPASLARDPQLMRAIPVLEVDQRDAAQIAMVLTAATALTSKQSANNGSHRIGRDIDAQPG